MSRGINKVILIGNLGNEPEIRYAPGGDCIANFSLASSENWKDKQTGQQQESLNDFGMLLGHVGGFAHIRAQVVELLHRLG